MPNRHLVRLLHVYTQLSLLNETVLERIDAKEGSCFLGNTPLMYACAGGHEEVVKALLEAGANVEDHNENGHTPLMEAASAGHVGVAKASSVFILSTTKLALLIVN